MANRNNQCYTKNMENKRKSPRGNISLKVSFRKMKNYLFSGSRIKNISETGLCMPLNVYFPVDSLLEVEVYLDESDVAIYGLARVVRVAERNNSRYRFDVGLEFLNLPHEKQKILRDYIHRFMSKTEHPNPLQK